MSHDEDLFGMVYEPGAVIFRQGEPGDRLYLIQSGAVEYSYQQGETETVLTVLGKGDFFGEMALFGQDRRPATAKAVRQTRLLPLTRAALRERIQEDPGVAFHLLQGLYSRIQHADRQLQQAVENSEVLRRALAKREAETPVEQPEVADRAAQPAVTAAAEVTIRELAAVWDVEAAALHLGPGERIYEPGDPSDAMYIVLSGAVEIGSGAGQDQYVMLRLQAGDFFGEAEIFTDRPRTASATAVQPSEVLRIDRAAFAERIQARPELALYLLEALSVRLQNLGAILANPHVAPEAVRRSWRPLLQNRERVRVAMVSLSTCAGCSAVFLDQGVLEQVLEAAEIVYCPMLIDQDRLPEADVALIDGAVRLKEDAERLEEAARKSRTVVAWGTCAAFGGIPAHANRYELEELIQETYGQAADAFAYYLSGTGGVEPTTYQEEGIPLLRKAYAADDFVRVDYYVPGCPPLPGLLLRLVGELRGESLQGAKPIVCAECSRRPAKVAVTSLEAYLRQPEEGTCFHSLGVLCSGFLSRGGCGAVCTRNGLPCWGCRGPARVVRKKMADGDSFEEVVIEMLTRRCRMEGATLKPAVKRLRRRGHGLFDFETSFLSSLARVR